MDRTMPHGWYVKAPNGAQFFRDFGLALAYALKTGGNVVPAFRLRATHEAY